MVSMQIADVQDEIDHELITKAQIASKIHEVAAQVSKDYQGRDLLLVAVLKGAVNTIAAFSQALSIPVQMDFMSLSSYGSGTESSGTIAIRQDLSCDVRGRHILIVEDIVGSNYYGSIGMVVAYSLVGAIGYLVAIVDYPYYCWI